MGSSNSTSSREDDSLSDLRPQQVFPVDDSLYSQRYIPRINNAPLRGSMMNLTPPPPRLDIQETCVVKNPVNLKKNTLLLEKDNQKNIYYLKFNFDALAPVEVCVLYNCKEIVQSPNGLPRFESLSGQEFFRKFNQGLNQLYSSSENEALIISNDTLTDVKIVENYKIYPVVIQLHPINKSAFFLEAEYSYATLFRSNSNLDTSWTIHLIRQTVQYENKCFEVQEVFGIDSTEKSGTNNQNDISTGRECVICLSEDRNTALLPCRHMCLCTHCARMIQSHSNKCPICRQHVSSLLQISVKHKLYT